MRALQELIPHCNKVRLHWTSSSSIITFIITCGQCFYTVNKSVLILILLFHYVKQTDKASMLDEAIEYLKSLQLQVQVSETATASSLAV